ncbi:MAG: SRPBCC family protein [Pseudomonadota bacterium]
MTSRRESTALVAASPEVLFDWLDDPARLGAHMTGSSVMMGGGAMSYEFDNDEGRALGSRIKMDGQAFGIDLSLEEVITQREPPSRKSWRTVGQPRLVVLGGYDMGFDIRPVGGGFRLRVWIDMDCPSGGSEGVSRCWGRCMPAGACGRW